MNALVSSGVEQIYKPLLSQTIERVVLVLKLLLRVGVESNRHLYAHIRIVLDPGDADSIFFFDQCALPTKLHVVQRIFSEHNIAQQLDDVLHIRSDVVWCFLDTPHHTTDVVPQFGDFRLVDAVTLV